MLIGYKDDKGNNMLRKSFCAYFDILGFSEKIKDEDYSFFENFDTIRSRSVP